MLWNDWFSRCPKSGWWHLLQETWFARRTQKNEAKTAETLNKQDSSEHNMNTKRNNTHVFAWRCSNAVAMFSTSNHNPVDATNSFWFTSSCSCPEPFPCSFELQLNSTLRNFAQSFKRTRMDESTRNQMQFLNPQIQFEAQLRCSFAALLFFHLEIYFFSRRNRAEGHF